MSLSIPARRHLFNGGRAKISPRTALIFMGLTLLSPQIALAEDSDPWVVGGSRVIDAWPSATNKVFVSEYFIDGGTRLCAATISPRLPGPSRYLSIQHFQGQNGLTFVAYQADWFLLRGSVFQIRAVFDQKTVVSLVGTGFGKEIKLGSDFGATAKINTLLSTSERLDIEFPERPGLTWRIGLQGMPEAMSKLRLCAAKPPAA